MRGLELNGTIVGYESGFCFVSPLHSLKLITKRNSKCQGWSHVSSRRILEHSSGYGLTSTAVGMQSHRLPMCWNVCHNNVLSEMLVYLRRKAPLQSLPRFIVSGFVRYVHLVPQPGLVFHFLPLFSRHASQKHLLLFSFLPLRPFSHLFSMAQFVQSDVGPAFLPSSRFLRLSLLSGVLLHLPFFVIVILLWK